MEKTTVNVVTRPAPPGERPRSGHWELVPEVQRLVPHFFREVPIRVPPRHPYRQVSPSLTSGRYYTRTIQLTGMPRRTIEFNVFLFGLLPHERIDEELAVIATEVLPYGFYDLERLYGQSPNASEAFQMGPGGHAGSVKEGEEIYFLIHSNALFIQTLNPTIAAIGRYSSRLNEGHGRVRQTDFRNSDDHRDPGNLYKAIMRYLTQLGERHEWRGESEGFRETYNEEDSEVTYIEQTLLPVVRKACELPETGT